MIQVDLSYARKFLSNEEFASAYQKAEQIYEALQQKKGPGSEWLGWQKILEDPNDAVLEELDSLAAAVRNEADVFLVCGIGGSYLGAQAVIDAMTPFFNESGSIEIIYCGHHLSGKYLQELIGYLEQPKEDGEPKSVYLNAISKSGTTLETALVFRTLRSWINKTFPEDARKRIICTTSPQGGALNELVKQEEYKKFEIPEDVGGRFSVLTPVGLLPIAVAGIDIRSMFYQAVSLYKELEQDATRVLEYAACRYQLGKKGITTDIITTFEPQLMSLGRWLQQLLGESEGKEGRGIFPAVATFSTDLHSIGQFIQEGPRNLMETFITIEKAVSHFEVAETEEDDDGLNYLSGRSFHEVNRNAFEGTLRAHVEGGVPAVVVTLEECNAQHIGEFIYFYELLTAVYCYCLEVNPFNQPGVEAYKKEMYNLLEKQIR